MFLDNSDPTVTSATQQANQGLTDAKDGIVTIAKALIQGQKAPASARDQVGQGLGTVQSAVNSIDSCVSFQLISFLDFFWNGMDG